MLNLIDQRFRVAVNMVLRPFLTAGINQRLM